MRVLITGAAGFIGSHVCERFLRAGFEVVAVDDLSSGRESNLPKGVDFRRLDVRDEAVSRLVRDLRPRAIAHLAAQIDVRRSVADPLADADINVMATLRLARDAAEAGCERIVFSSTGGAIYGEQDVFPASETHACRPVSPYGTAKLCAEHYLAFFERSGGAACVRLRYANVYGPRQDPHGEAGVVAIFAGKLLAGQTCTVHGSGEQTRDFVYVRDVAEANFLAISTEASGAYNIGTGLETDINSLYARMARIAGVDLPVRYGPQAPGEQLRSSIDPSAAGRDLGWKPETDLDTGLRETIEFFRHSDTGARR
ncbi:MAG: NAD-dependent epimerase/dehydratase family protein [Deltaproteobacteria bacterium]|nr:NAD-dependent epimerase/dehydratase family protein [Deltaproteobacteria bacterium]